MSFSFNISTKPTNTTGIVGGLTILSRNVPDIACRAVALSFPRLFQRSPGSLVDRTVKATDCAWALHPGGLAVIEGVKKMMALDSGQLHTSEEVYRKHGNSSSPTVLIVLDKMRKSAPNQRPVVAAAFGPGMSVELALLRRCS